MLNRYQLIFVVAVLLDISVVVKAYKILLFATTLSNSQLLFNSRVGDLLAGAGHDVVFYAPKLNPDVKPAPVKKCRLWEVAAGDPADFMNAMGNQYSQVYNDSDPMKRGGLAQLANISKKFVDTCELQLTNKDLMRRLTNERFDLAIAHMHEPCPLVMIEVLQIPTWIWMSNGILIETHASSIGVPTPVSYVPGVMTAFTDNMSFVERAKNAAGFVMFEQVMNYMIYKPYNELIRKTYGLVFPTVEQLSSRAPLVFVNSEEFFDFPRPILHKTVYIGGIGMKEPKPLNDLVTTATGAVSDAVKGQLQGTGLLKQMVRRLRKRDIQAPPAPATLDVLEIPAEWQQYEKAPGRWSTASCGTELQSICASAKRGVVVFSLGSVADPKYMPEAWRRAFVGAFARFGDYQFIWRFDPEHMPEGELPPNVHVFRWLPQTDLLGHASTRAFITHGGYNSVLEAANAGVPLVSIPLFGDQFRNARAAQRHGIAVLLYKSEISESSVYTALKTVLEDEKYGREAKKLSRMIKKKPVKSEELIVRWTEFLAEFQKLPHLDIVGKDLNFAQYFLLDVIFCLLAGVCFILYIAYTFVCVCIWRKKGRQSDKSKKE